MTMTSKARYNKELFINSVKGLPRQEQLYAVGALITYYYNRRYEGVGMVVVGGLSSSYHSNSQYLTDDVDLVVLDDELYQEVMVDLGFNRGIKHNYSSRYWVYEELSIAVEAPGSNFDTVDLTRINRVTIAGYTLYIQGVDDIFNDRLMGYATGRYDDYLEQLDSLYRHNKDKLDWGYITKSCQSRQERLILSKLRERYERQSIELDFASIKYDELYLYLDDDSISTVRLRGWYVVTMSKAVIYVSKKGGIAILGGYINGYKVYFTTTLSRYYQGGMDETVGFSIQDVRKYNGNFIDYVLFRRILNTYAINQVSKNGYLTYTQYKRAGIGVDFKSYVNNLTIHNQTTNQVSQRLRSSLAKKYKTFEQETFLRYGTLWVEGYLILVGKRVFILDIEDDEVLMYDSPSNVGVGRILSAIKKVKHT